MFHRAAVHQCPSILFPCPVVYSVQEVFLISIEPLTLFSHHL